MATDVTPPAVATITEQTDEPDLRDLVALATGGDAGAAEALLTQLRPLIVRYCRGRLGRVPGADFAADDAAQEVLLAVLSALPRYRDEGRPFEAFVFGDFRRKRFGFLCGRHAAEGRGAVSLDRKLHGRKPRANCFRVGVGAKHLFGLRARAREHDVAQRE